MNKSSNVYLDYPVVSYMVSSGFLTRIPKIYLQLKLEHATVK